MCLLKPTTQTTLAAIMTAGFATQKQITFALYRQRRKKHILYFVMNLCGIVGITNTAKPTAATQPDTLCRLPHLLITAVITACYWRMMRNVNYPMLGYGCIRCPVVDMGVMGY